MRDFLLDTQTVRYWYDTKCRQHQVVMANIASFRKQTELLEHKARLLVSVITLGEIEYGHRVNLPSDPNVQAEYLRFIDEKLPDRWEVYMDAVTIYGELRSRLFNEYAPRGKRTPKMRPEQLIDPIIRITISSCACVTAPQSSGGAAQNMALRRSLPLARIAYFNMRARILWNPYDPVNPSLLCLGRGGCMTHTGQASHVRDWPGVTAAL